MKNIFDFLTIWGMAQISALIIVAAIVGIMHLCDMLPTVILFAMVIVPLILSIVLTILINKKEK